MQYEVKHVGPYGTEVRMWCGGEAPARPARPATGRFALVLIPVLAAMVHLVRPDLLASFISAVLAIAITTWIVRSI